VSYLWLATMRSFAPLCLVQLSFASSEFDSIVDAVHAQALPWQAQRPTRFETLDDVRVQCGTIIEETPSLPVKSGLTVADDIPTEFDARTQWPQCAYPIGFVRDQSACGSCWAFSSTESFNDRWCIATGDNTTLMAPLDPMAQMNGFFGYSSNGCNGGLLTEAWGFFHSHGVVSGGEYSSVGKADSCAPYPFERCAHHMGHNTSSYPECPEDEYPSPGMFKECPEASYGTDYQSDKHFAVSAYSFPRKNVELIQTNIMENGPVAASFYVYDDFPTYESGVYKRSENATILGGHGIKIIGWGTENGEDYWLCVNSWNEEWGDKGLFKIARGSDECGIENGVVAGEVTGEAPGSIALV